MRLLLSLLITIILLSSTTVLAEAPVPKEKPIKPKAVIIRPSDKPNDSTDFSMVNKKYVFNADNLKSGGTIIPPSLPDIKIRQTSSSSSQLKNGIIIPSNKPLVIAVNKLERTTADKNFEESVLVRYTNNKIDNLEDRFAGDRGHEIKIQRLPSQPKLRIRETNERSPFKTASLSRAGKTSDSDPIIVFFKERSSDLEVGQLSIIDNDIFNILKMRKNKKAAIYGFSESNSTDDNMNQLSLSRALIISEYLVSKGIDAERIEARAMGPDTPISPKNRVDVVIFD